MNRVLLFVRNPISSQLIVLPVSLVMEFSCRVN